MANIRDVGKGLMGWLPLIAVVAAAYKYYADRGFDGIVTDLQSITYQGIQGKIQTIAIGFAFLLGAPILARYIPNASLRSPVKAVMYYVGATQLFGALRSGAGGGRGWISAGKQPMSASGIYQGRRY